MKAKLKPQDLRIGNLVLDESNKIAVVTALDFERKFYHEAKEKTFIGSCSLKLLEKYEWNTSFGRWVENLKPIPLTEEWLEKFNFEKKFDYFSNGKLHLYKLEDGWYRQVWTPGSYGCDADYEVHDDEHPINTVHHLQNFYYFNYGGEELTLTETP